MADEQIATAPVLVLGNKIDIPGAASEDEIRHHFGLHGNTTGKVKLGYYSLTSWILISKTKIFSLKLDPSLLDLFN